MIGLSDLNANQRQAAEWNDGPMLVLAGPGSGKTVVLTLRVVRLLEENENATALALTFTNKAAAEMRNRVDKGLGGHTDRARLGTFHAFAADLLGQHGGHLQIRTNFQLLTQDEDRIAILKDAIRDLPDGHDELPEDPKHLLRLIDRLFSESYGGEGPSDSLPKTPEWLPGLFRLYCDALVAANRLDFGSLLHFANRLLREKQTVARVTRLAWTHVCVDEFQDTNRAQYDLIRLIAPGRRHNLFVVGDKNQIIYQWNGASPKRFDELRRDYELTTAQLPENYRSPPDIVARANRLIAHNMESTLTPMVSVKEPQAPSAEVVRHKAVLAQSQEAQLVGLDIVNRGLAPAECAVLGRTNQLARIAAKVLRKGGHEAFVPQRKHDFDSPVLGVLGEALRLAHSRHDWFVLGKMCRRWKRLTDVEIEPHAVEAAAALVGGDFLRAWVEAAEAADSGRNRVALKRIRADLLERLNFPIVLDAVLEGEWHPLDDDTAGPQDEVETWRALHREILHEHGAGVTLNTYLQRLDLSSKVPPPPPNAILCSTVHGSKGLQFRHVYLIGLAQEVFPSFQALQKGPESRALEEERRSCFVAITRAQETLTLTRAGRYRGWPKDPSQFLSEMGLA